MGEAVERPDRWVRVLWRRSAPVLAKAAIPTALLIAVVTVHHYVHRFVSDSSVFTVPGAALQSSGLLPGGAGDISIFDEDVLKRLAREIESRPEVRRVTSLERSFPGSIRAKVERRSPWLHFWVGAGLAVFDRDGILMGAARGTNPDLLKVEGALGPFPAPSRRAEGEEFAAAFRMAEIVRADEWLSSRVTTIDISNLGRRRSTMDPDISLVTRAGCRIHWGRAAGREAEELSVDEKLSNLRSAVSRYPDLRGLEYVKVYVKDRPTVKRSGDRLANASR